VLQMHSLYTGPRSITYLPAARLYKHSLLGLEATGMSSSGV